MSKLSRRHVIRTVAVGVGAVGAGLSLRAQPARPVLEQGKYEGGVFTHPHDVIVDDEVSLYVAQFASGQSYPIKLEWV